MSPMIFVRRGMEIDRVGFVRAGAAVKEVIRVTLENGSGVRLVVKDCKKA